MGNSATNAFVFIINSLAQLYLLVLLLRFLLPWMAVNFNNPISQAILRLTSPLVIPVRRILPAIGKIDTATVVVAYGIQYLTILVIVMILGLPPTIVPIAVTAAVNLVLLTLKLFIFAIIIRSELARRRRLQSGDRRHRCNHRAGAATVPQSRAADRWPRHLTDLRHHPALGGRDSA